MKNRAGSRTRASIFENKVPQKGSPFGSALGKRFGGFLERSWRCFGVSWRPLGGLLEASWKLLDVFWTLLESSWTLLEASWRLLGNSWRCLGSSFKGIGGSRTEHRPPKAIQDRFGDRFWIPVDLKIYAPVDARALILKKRRFRNRSRCRSQHRPRNEFLGVSWGVFGRSWRYLADFVGGSSTL